MIYNYDVFISYKSEQESWALRLASTLRSFGIKVWRDHDAGNGIRVSQAWTQEVKNGIRDSKVMIVLWSNLIANNANSIVLEEINQMRTLVQNDDTGERRFIPVNLDNTPTRDYIPLSPYQADISFQELYSKVGPAGADQISAIEWYGAVKTLIDVLGITDVVEIRFVVAAMNRNQAQQLFDHPETYATDTNAFQLIVSMMEKTSAFDVNRYGKSPNDWKPFPQLEDIWSVKELLNAYDNDKRMWLQEKQEYTKWILVSYSDDMVSTVSEIRNRAREIVQEGPCFVIIDPVSLMHKDVYQTIITNGGLQNHPEAFVIGIAPFVSQMHHELYNATIQIEEHLEQLLASAYTRFRKHFEPVNKACIMNVEQEYQFMRWLQVAADNIISVNKTQLRKVGVKASPNMRRLMRQSVNNQPGPEVIDMSGKGGNV